MKKKWSLCLINLRLLKRNIKHFFQRLINGWSDDETWSLDITVSDYLVPRLKRLKELKHGHPSCFQTMEEWNEILDKMIYAFTECSNEFNREYPGTVSKERARQRKIKIGLNLFAKHFQNLWW